MTKTITTTDAPTLADLCETLNDADDEYSAAVRDGEDADDLRVDVRYDITSLPTYGGTEPSDTTGIYSWDADGVLCVLDHGDRPWTISPREAEPVECAYCAEMVDPAQPSSDDDWADATEQHAPGCEWTATRAHTTDETTDPLVSLYA